MTYLTNSIFTKQSRRASTWKRDPFGVFWLQFRNFFTLDSENAFILWPHGEEMRARLTNGERDESPQTETIVEAEINAEDAEPRMATVGSDDTDSSKQENPQGKTTEKR